VSLLNVLIGLDQTANAAWGGNPDETISSRVGKAAERGARRAIIAEAAIDMAFSFVGQRHHCAASIERDEA
jgi:hypothetical protein